MSDQVEGDAHKRFAESLREIAAFYEAHPEIPLPLAEIGNYAVDTKNDAINVVRALGSCKKEYLDDYFTITKQVGDLTHKFVFSRANVCTRREVGESIIPEQVIPAQTVKVYEWDCHPVLAPESP